jgi:hypothetical protein
LLAPLLVAILLSTVVGYASLTRPTSRRKMTGRKCGAQRQTDLPVGQNWFDFTPRTSPEASQGARKRLRQTANLSSGFKLISPFRYPAKNISLFLRRKPCLPLMHPASCRGAYASSRYAELRAAMDAEAAPDERERPRTVKSCGPGAPRLALNSQRRFRVLRATVTTKSGHRGEHEGSR